MLMFPETMGAIAEFASNAWDVAHGRGPDLEPAPAQDPANTGLHGEAGLHRANGGKGPVVGASAKFGTGPEGPPYARTPEGASGEAGLGHYRDANGDKAYGAWVEGQVQKQSGDILGSSKPVPGEAKGPHSYLGYEASKADGSLGVKVTDKCTQVSAQASGPSASLVMGSRGSDTDTELKAGISPMGPGGGMRFHYDDADKDGIPEYGVGIDLGIFTGDLKTEDPLGMALSVLTGGLATPRGDEQPRNLTRAAKDIFKHWIE